MLWACQTLEHLGCPWILRLAQVLAVFFSKISRHFLHLILEVFVWIDFCLNGDSTWSFRSLDPYIVWIFGRKELKSFDTLAQLYSLGMQVPLKRYAVYGVVYWIATCHQKVKIRAAVSCQAHHLPLPQIACFATYFELREQSLWAVTEPKEQNKFVLQVSFVTKSHQLHEVVWNTHKNWTKPHIFPIQFDLSQIVSKCAILLQCYTFWSVWEKGIF